MTRKLLLASTAIALALSSTTATAQSASASRAGGVGLEGFASSDGIYGGGVIVRATSRIAFVVDGGAASLRRNETVRVGGAPNIYNDRESLRVATIGLRYTPRIVAGVNAVLGAGFATSRYESTSTDQTSGSTQGQRETRRGPYAEVGGEYRVVPRVSIGAALRVASQSIRGTTNYGSGVIGSVDGRYTTTIFQPLRVALYF